MSFLEAFITGAANAANEAIDARREQQAKMDFIRAKQADELKSYMDKSGFNNLREELDYRDRLEKSEVEHKAVIDVETHGKKSAITLSQTRDIQEMRNEAERERTGFSTLKERMQFEADSRPTKVNKDTPLGLQNSLVKSAFNTAVKESAATGEPVTEVLKRLGVTDFTGSIGQTISKKPQADMEIPGARKAPDGNYYVPDPARPGKYLRVKIPAPTDSSSPE